MAPDIIKEDQPDTFEVEQTVHTKLGAKTCTLERKNDQIVLITQNGAPAAKPRCAPPTAAKRRRRRGGGRPA